LGVRILYISEIVGKAGIWCVKSVLPILKKSENPDLVIANGDGATGSYGLGRQHAGYLRKMGIDVITGGECIYYKKDLVEGFDTLPYVIRPANYPAESPGRGFRIVQAGKERVAVVSMLGRVGFSRVHSDNPFTAIPSLAERLRRETPYVIVDFHACATAEKQAFFFHADGKVSAVIGSHGRVPTSDETILPGGTACITDAGRTGSVDSVGGSDPAPKIREYLMRVPDWSRDAWARPVFQGVVIDLDGSGKACSIKRISMAAPEPPHDENEEAAHAGKGAGSQD
jgi:metallophosphoesterase (TIGR00282 family)